MAEVYETANASIDKRSDVDDKPILSKFWRGELAAAKKRDEGWHNRADKVIERYRDEREHDRGANAERRANILWSNTETLKSALFQGMGNPDVRRRFPKKGDDDKAARQAALALERGLSYCADAYDAESQIDACIEDYLLPGRGTGWLVYDADTAEGYGEGAAASGEGLYSSSSASSIGAANGYATPTLSPQEEGGLVGPQGPQVTNQSVRVDHVFYKDFLTSAGRKWSDVWWCARRHCYSRDELKRYWPKHAEKIPLNVSVAGYDNSKKGSKDEEDTFKRASVWEIWDKSKKERVRVAEDYDLVLDTTPDPYRLRDFFPTVEPLYGVKTTSSLTPIPEYTLYQDQAEELDILQTRLCRLIAAMKRRGIYDATAEGSENELSKLAHADDNQFLPYKNFAALLEKGGLKNVFQAEDLAPFVAVIQTLSEREQALLAKIYEITGISDIMRGASDPGETATGVRGKMQFGSLRLQKRQKRIQTFIRDLYRLKAEIIAEHFTRDHLVEMTGIDMPLKAEQEQAKMMLAAIQQREQQAKAMAQQGQGAVQPPPPVPPQVMQKLIATAKAVPWEEIASILRSDQRRGYKVDVETDATNAMDSETEKAQRIEFLTAMGAMLEKSLPMIAQAPPPAAAALITLLKENAMFAAAAFKAGRTMEEAYEDAFTKLEEQAKAQASQPPKPSPEEQKLQADVQAKQTEFQFRAKEAEQSQQLEQQRFAHEAKLKEQELQHTVQLETFKAQNEAKLAEAKMAQEAQLRQYQAEQDMQMRSQEFEANQAMAQQELGHKRQIETDKLGFERERHGQQMDLERGKAESKFMLDAYGAAATEGNGEDGAAPPAARGRLNPLSEMLQVMQDAIQQQATMFQAALQQIAEQNVQVLKAVTAPRRAVRDPASGRLSGVEVMMQ